MALSVLAGQASGRLISFSYGSAQLDLLQLHIGGWELLSTHRYDNIAALILDFKLSFCLILNVLTLYMFIKFRKSLFSIWPVFLGLL